MCPDRTTFYSVTQSCFEALRICKDKKNLTKKKKKLKSCRNAEMLCNRSFIYYINWPRNTAKDIALSMKSLLYKESSKGHIWWWDFLSDLFCRGEFHFRASAVTLYTCGKAFWHQDFKIITRSGFMLVLLIYIFCYFFQNSERFLYLNCLFGLCENSWPFHLAPLLFSCSTCLFSELFPIIPPLKYEDKIVSACDLLLANWEDHYQPLTPHFIPTFGMNIWFWLLIEANGKLNSLITFKIFWTENANVMHNSWQWTSRFSDF